MMNERFGVAKKRYATSIVMPCSRSARRPSIRCARSTSARATSSAISAFASYSSRPIRVLLPSSTEPAVARRRSSPERDIARHLIRARNYNSRPMPDPRELAAVFAGGVAGAMARAGVLEALPHDPGRWPWATLLVNVAGAFVLGAVAAHGPRRALLGQGF